MSLSATVRSGVDTAFAALGDLVETVTYRRQTGGSYDVTSGAVTATATDATIDAVFVEYSFRERANSAIQPNDRRCLIQGSAITFAPQVADVLVQESGDLWDVVAVTMLGTHDAPEAVAAWDLQVRRPG